MSNVEKLAEALGCVNSKDVSDALSAAGLELNPEGTARERDKLKAGVDPAPKQWSHETVGTVKGDPDLWEKMAAYAEQRLSEGEEWMTISMKQYAGLLLGMHLKKQLQDRYARTGHALTEGEG